MLQCLERCSLVGTTAKLARAKLLVRSAHPAYEELNVPAVNEALFSQGGFSVLPLDQQAQDALVPSDLIAQPSEASRGLNLESAAL